MSDNQYNPDKLAEDLQDANLGNQQYDPSGQTFVPQGGYQQYNNYQQGSYQYDNSQGYNARGGYQNNSGTQNLYTPNQYTPNQYTPNQYTPNQGLYNLYNQGYQAQSYQPQSYQPQSYQSYNPGYQQPQQGMSLADFQKQQAAGLASLNKPKKTLKLASSSGIKLANASKAVEKKETEPKEATPQPKATATPTKEASKEPEQKEEAAKVQPKEVAKPKVSAKSTPLATKESTPVPSVDSLIKEQEDIVDEEVVRDMFGGKDHLSIIFMGHVDAGKSTMGGNLLYLTGAVDKRTVEKYEREAKDAGRQGWYLSWVMDTNKEERNDGKTIEVGKACFETEKRRYTILDAPGHKMYVSEMIGGASQADVGILVISARKGEYETGFEKGGQTREHALLAKTQGVNKIIVVVNKMDDPTVGWAEDRYKDCTTKLGQFLKGIGYAKDDIVFMPVSGYTGAGLKERVNASDCPWYKGPALLEYLDDMKTADRKMNAPFMLPISSKMKDMGTIVEGKVESGHIKKNASLLLMPNRATVEVVAIYNETEQECDAAYCGEQIKLKLKGVEEEDVAPGYVLTSPKNPIKTVTRFEAQIAIVELRSILSNGFSCVMHLHAAIEEVTFVELKHKLEKGTNRKSKKPPAFAKKGMKIIAILETTEPVCAETYNDYQQLGRFTLRDQGTTIAIGKITKLL